MFMRALHRSGSPSGYQSRHTTGIPPSHGAMAVVMEPSSSSPQRRTSSASSTCSWLLGLAALKAVQPSSTHMLMAARGGRRPSERKLYTRRGAITEQALMAPCA